MANQSIPELLQKLRQIREKRETNLALMQQANRLKLKAGIHLNDMHPAMAEHLATYYSATCRQKNTWRAMAAILNACVVYRQTEFILSVQCLSNLFAHDPNIAEPISFTKDTRDPIIQNLAPKKGDPTLAFMVCTVQGTYNSNGGGKSSQFRLTGEGLAAYEALVAIIDADKASDDEEEEELDDVQPVLEVATKQEVVAPALSGITEKYSIWGTLTIDHDARLVSGSCRKKLEDMLEWCLNTDDTEWHYYAENYHWELTFVERHQEDWSFLEQEVCS